MAVHSIVFLIWQMALDIRHPYPYRKQFGVVLLSILMILILLSTFAIYQVESQNISIRKVSNILESEQAYQIVMGAEQWAVKLLEKDLQADLQNGNLDFDHLAEFWANLGPAVKVEGTESQMTILITDEQGKFNINNLIQGKPEDSNKIESSTENNADQGSENSQQDQLSWYTLYQKLFLDIGLNPQLTDAIIDWIDNDSNTIGVSGAEDGFYGRLESPYRSANQQLSSLIELRNIRGFDDQIIKQLSTVMTAIPLETKNDFSKLNVNTASAEVLSFISDDPALSTEPLIALTELRLQKPFESVEDFINAFLANVPSTLISGIERFLDIKSDYFLSRSCAQSGRVESSQFSLLRKNRTQENVTVHLRQSSQGCTENLSSDSNSDNS